MTIICEPANYDACAMTVTRKSAGRYVLDAHHRHEGSKSYCPNSERYDDLTWMELLDVMLVVADGRRPGMHPAGWEQGLLFDL